MILNYTTKISASRTIAEIQQTLASKGAGHVSVDYEDCRATAVVFSVKVGGTFVNFRLPCNVAGVGNALRRERPNASIWRDADQCERIACRIVKDWVEAQMALIEAQQAEFGEVFMPYAIDGKGQTFFQKFKGDQLALTSGSEAA